MRDAMDIADELEILPQGSSASDLHQLGLHQMNDSAKKQDLLDNSDNSRISFSEIKQKDTSRISSFYQKLDEVERQIEEEE